MCVAQNCRQELAMSDQSSCRRDGHQRAEVVKHIVDRLRHTTSCSIQALAYAAGDVPERIVRRVITRFAVRGLVRNDANGYWTATGALRTDAEVAICSVD
jgi:hypothetical protein